MAIRPDSGTVTLDGEPLDLPVERELGLNVVSDYVDIGPGATRRIDVELAGGLDLSDGWYRFTYVPQVQNLQDRVSWGVDLDGAVAGEVVRIGNAQVWGGKNVPSQMPGPASKLYAQNLVNIPTLMTTKGEDGVASFAPDFEDEIVDKSCVTREGAIHHEPTRVAIEGDSQS